MSSAPAHTFGISVSHLPLAGLAGLTALGVRFVLKAVLVLLVAACAPTPDEVEETNPSGDENTEAREQFDARYLMHLAFAGRDGSAFVGIFDQTTQGTMLRRSYQAWATDGRTSLDGTVTDGGNAGDDQDTGDGQEDVGSRTDDVNLEGAGPQWRQLTDTQDELPVARAAWRILPTEDMTIRVGGGGQVVSLSFQDTEEGDPAIHLLAGEELAAWTGPTGQRESLGEARLDVGNGAESGILFFRRAARALTLSPETLLETTFVLTDSLGNALLLNARSGATDEEGIGSAIAHTLLHGVSTAWGDVSLDPPTGDETNWRVELAEGGLAGYLRPLEISADADPSQGPVSFEAVLSAGGYQFHLVGLATLLDSP